ncbi:barstar family protein [Streptomyces antimycoticus]|uniref:barstar family protein n=1 Tax=Streptomyces antimycoticus TaxID=68175 RepID=UPI003428B644
MYRLIEDETQREILTAADIHGFFVEPSTAESESVIVIGSSLNPGKLPLSFEDVEFQVRDVQGKEIGAYYVGHVEVLGAKESGAIQDRVDLTVSLDGYALPYPYAGEIWRAWTYGPPAEPGLWKSLPAEAHESWLHVVQKAWFRSGRQAMLYGDADTYEIAGADLANIHSFYCALGEAVNGPGGYLGSNPSALADCLFNSRGKHKKLFRLAWRDFDVSRRNIDEEELDWALEVMRDYGVDIE